MREWLRDFRNLWKNKFYAAAVTLTAAFSYGFMITHHSVGIDDTPFAYYFEEGLAAIVGRWVLFLLNKAVHIAEFAPFVTDLAAVLLFLAGVTVWCALLRRILGERIPMYGYVLFSCLFLSNPLLSEVFTYYLHNGVAIGYLACGVSLCFFREAMERLGTGWTARAALPLGGCALGLWVALGCYESFMIVYLVGVCVVLWASRLGADGKKSRVLAGLCCAALAGAAALVLRSVTVAAVTEIFGLQELRGQAVQRSITEMAGWILKPGALAELGMILKRVFVMYGVFALAYYPILVYVTALACALLFGLWYAFRRRDLWIVFLAAGSVAASFLLVLVEGKATLYRSAQFLPLFCAWGLLLPVYALHSLTGRKAATGAVEEGAAGLRGVGKAATSAVEEGGPGLRGVGESASCAVEEGGPSLRGAGKAATSAVEEGGPGLRGARESASSAVEEAGSGLRGAGKAERPNVGKTGRKGPRRAGIAAEAVLAAALAVVVWNQCTDMNRWFYVDYLKYEDAKNTMNYIAYELEKSFDTSKPVIFTGTYQIPKSIVKDAYVEYNSETFYRMSRLAGLADPHLLEKFYRDYGVWVAQTPSLSVLDWGRYAFDDDGELVRFFSMHGHELLPETDTSLYAPAEEFSLTLPSFPEEGSIVDMGEYLIVHF